MTLALHLGAAVSVPVRSLAHALDLYTERVDRLEMPEEERGNW